MNRTKDHRLLWFDRYGGERKWGGPDLRSRSRKRTRVVSGILAVAITAGLLRWGVMAWRLLDPCARIGYSGQGDCEAPPVVFQWLQFGVAVPGIVAGAAALVYLVHLATSGRTWRNWQRVAIAFGTLVLAWTVVFAAGAVWVTIATR